MPTLRPTRSPAPPADSSDVVRSDVDAVEEEKKAPHSYRSKGKVLTLRDALCLVVEQGLTPDMALRACHNPKVTNFNLSRALAGAISERAKEAAREARVRVRARVGEEAAARAKEGERGGGSAGSAGEGGGENAGEGGGSRKRRRTDASFADGAAAAIEQILSPSHSFSAPYLKGKPTHFERKVRAKAERLLQNPPVEESPADELRNPRGTKEAYARAFEEATRRFADLKDCDRAGPIIETQRRIVDELNEKWALDGEGRGSSREKVALSVRTVQRAVREGRVGTVPPKKGPVPRKGAAVRPPPPRTKRTVAVRAEARRSTEEEDEPRAEEAPAKGPRKGARVGSAKAGPRKGRERPPRRGKRNAPTAAEGGKAPERAPGAKRSTEEDEFSAGDSELRTGAKERYGHAFQEATRLFSDLKEGRFHGPAMPTQRQIVDELNEKYALDGAKCGSSREKHVLAVRTIQRAVREGNVGGGPRRKGPPTRKKKKTKEPPKEEGASEEEEGASSEPVVLPLLFDEGWGGSMLDPDCSCPSCF